MPRPTLAQTQRAAHYHELARSVRELETDLRWGLTDSPRIPHGWRAIAEGPAVPKKAKLTLRLDADVVAFFRAMGMGHLTRMNAVLRVFMLARLAGVVGGPGDVSYAPTAAEEEASLRREILDAAAADWAAKEAADARASDAVKRRKRIAELTALRDARRGGR